MKKKLLISGGLLCTSALMAQTERPNIIWIVSDDMRATTLEFLNQEQVKTPQLNRLAEDCTVFTNAHIMGGSTGAVSLPSRAMLMTGKYLYKLQQHGRKIPEEQKTVGEALQQAGYYTFHIGKWDSDHAALNRTFCSGDDLFFGGMGDHWNAPLFHYHPDGVYKNSRQVIKDPGKNNNVEILRGEYVHSGKHSVDIFTDTALDFIYGRKVDDDQPFFLTVCYISPHDPRSMPKEFMDWYDVDQIELPPNYMAGHPFDNGELVIRDEVLAAIPRQEAEVRRHIAEYYAMISHLDDRIGKLIDALKETNQYDNTVVVFMADNGLAVGQHGLMGKQNVYSHSVNVPLMIKEAGQSAPMRMTDDLCYLIDLFPTMCDLAGADTPSSVDGVSLMPILHEQKAVRPALYMGYKNFQRAVTDGDWKLIEYNVEGVKTTQLFNVKNDPWEITDLSNDRKQQKRMDHLRKQMDQFRDVTGDSVFVWD